MGKPFKKSFEQWCIENNLQWILNLWDYDKNSKKPSEVGSGTDQKYYFKCERGLHESVLVTINNITSAKKQRKFCKVCQSFGQWCLDHNRQDFLDRWDYKLNKISPFEVSYASGKRYFFICPNHNPLHASTPKVLCNYIKSQGIKECVGCDSLGQWALDNIGVDFFTKYWSDKNTVDPFTIYKLGTSKIIIKCQSVSYHEYEIACHNFVTGKRCSYCGHRKVNKYDSVAAVYPKILPRWSDKNKKTAYEYSPHSEKRIWFHCDKHGDYERRVCDITVLDCNCLYCLQEDNFSILEKKVNRFLTEDLGYEVLHERRCNIMPFNPKTGRELPYDNEIPELKLIIEVHGQQHYEITSFTHMTAEKQNTTPKEVLLYQQWKDEYKKQLSE